MPAIIGPDGFLCSRSDPHYAFHVRLNEILIEQAKPGAEAYAVAGAGVGRLRKHFSERELVELITVIIMRRAWVALQAKDIAQPTLWRDVSTTSAHISITRSCPSPRLICAVLCRYATRICG